MAPSAVDGPVSTPTTELPEEVSKPPEGVVLPPKDIRNIVEKTAGFVARNGHVFEDRVREKEKNNPKFSFLLHNDAYSPFYLWRLSEIKAGRGTDVSAGRPGEPQAAQPEAEEPKGPVAPPEFRFSARMPNISALDLEVIKLTALFVAQRGKSFMAALSQKEARNYQFDFLRPQHSLYQFFARLVDQYAELLGTQDEDAAKSREQRLAELDKNIRDKYHILDRAKQRAEWVKFLEEKKQKEEEQEEKEKVEYAQIDWHDFVVVETVTFNEADDQAELPPPTSLNDLQTASLEQKAMMSLQPQGKRVEEAMPTDEDTTTYYNAYPAPAETPSSQAGPVAPTPYPQQPQHPVPAASQTSSAYPTHSPTPLSTPTPPVAAQEEERAAATPPPAAAAAAAPAAQPQPMRIRQDYVPRAQARRLNTNVPSSTCPYCGQTIPNAELEQHMRIELTDPRWKEQRAKADERYATTNLSTADVANNLKRLASQRSDVFDPVPAAAQQPQQTQQQQDFDPSYGSATATDEESRRKRMAMGIGPGLPTAMPVPTTGTAPGAEGLPPGYGPPPQTQGQTPAQAPGQETQGPANLPPPPASSGAGQNVNIEEQIRQIHQKFKQ